MTSQVSPQTGPWTMHHFWREMGLQVLVLVAYLLAARLGHVLSGTMDDASLIWPASGVALAAILLGGYRILPGLIASAMTEVLWSRGSILTTPMITTGVILGPLIARWLLQYLSDFSHMLMRMRDVMWLILLGGVVGPIVPAVFGATALSFLQPAEVPSRSWLTLAETWWFGDAMGILIVTPFLLIWLTNPIPRLAPGRRWELVCLLGGTLLVGWLVYFQGWGMVQISSRPWNFLVFPLVLLAGFRFGRHGAVTVSLLVVTLAIVGTSLKLGPFTDMDIETSWEQLGLFLGVVNTSSLLLATALHERKQAQVDIDQSHRRLDAILASVPGMVYRCRMDEAWTMTYISPGGADLTGYPTQDLLHNRRLSFNDLILPEDRAEVSRIIHEQVRVGRPYQLAYRIRTADGTVKWIWEQGIGVAQGQGDQVTHLEGVLLDITDRKSMEQSLRESEERAREMAGRLQLLLREVDHRVKNNLAGLFALLDMYARKAGSVTELSQALHGKLLAMKSAHELIADAGWQTVDLARLVRTLARQFVGEHGGERTLHITGPTLYVAPRQVGPMAMIMQELFTNSLKYGSFTTAQGQVTITWNLLESTASGKKVQLLWHESGGPPVIMPPKFGQGLSLIWGFCHYELAGRCEFQFDPQGFRCEIHWINEP